MKLQIRETTDDDLNEILKVERLAFGQEEEANLVADLLNDKTAEPRLSLLAFEGEEAIGHILFTKVVSEDPALMHILAPLAVVPNAQEKGVGAQLIEFGLNLLKARGSELVFVLGHEDYYPKFGFVPNAEKFGIKPPFPIPPEHANAWMFQQLTDNEFPTGPVQIRCADAMNKEHYWRE